MDNCLRHKIASWVLRIVVVGILVQTLFFKFTGAMESVYIFSTLGMEPWGRIGSGIVELVAAIPLLTPRTVVYGAVLALGVISGAIVSHLTKLGIVVLDDGGLLFVLALVVFAGSFALLVLHRRPLIQFVVSLLNREKGSHAMKAIQLIVCVATALALCAGAHAAAEKSLVDKDKDGVALKGYDPVAYFQNE